MIKLSENFPKEIRRLADESGMTRPEFARQLGVTESTLQKWLKGTNSPSLKKIEEISSILKRPVATLMGLQEPDKGRDQLVLEIIGATQKLKDKTNLEAVKTLAVGLLEDEQEKENLIQPESKAQ